MPRADHCNIKLQCRLLWHPYCYIFKLSGRDSFNRGILGTTFFLPQLLELCLTYHIYPKRSVGMMTTAAFCCFYLTWILIVAYVADLWVYPILEVLSPVQRYFTDRLLLFIFRNYILPIFFLCVI
jgi:hypothetical protein